MRRGFPPLIGLLIAATVLAAVPAAFAASPGGFPFRPDPRPISPPTVVSDIGEPTDLGGPADAPLPPHLGIGARPDRPHDAGAVADRPVPRPAIPNEIKARCVGSVHESGRGSVECTWTTRDDLDVAGWQLWKLQVRPDHGERALIAELRPEVTTFVDTDVLVPAHYIYGVLGVDASGEVIARSPAVPANLATQPAGDKHLRLNCRPMITIDVVDDATAVPPSIGCEWSTTEDNTATGYVLWRLVDEGDRHEVARGGLDALRYVDSDVAIGHRYTYIVTAVDSSGEVVAKSREEHVGLPPRHRPKPETMIEPAPIPGPKPKPVDRKPRPIAPVGPHAKRDPLPQDPQDAQIVPTPGSSLLPITPTAPDGPTAPMTTDPSAAETTAAPAFGAPRTSASG